MSFDPFSLEDQEMFPLWKALQERDFQKASKLVAAGAQLDDIIEEDGDSFLHEAAQEGEKEMVDFYIKNDCPTTLETFDCLAQTPLIHASANGHTDVVVTLLSKGANPNARDEGRIENTALREAVRGGHFEIVSLLLRAGGDPTLPGWMAISAVDQAQYEIEGGLESANALRIQEILSQFPSLLRDKTKSRIKGGTA